MSFRDIGVILNKTFAEKVEGLREQHEEIQQLSVSSQAYKLFSERKTPLEVVITLNLRESEATKFYKEYWKLKQLHNLNIVYEEVRGDMAPFLKLYRLSKAKGMGVKQVVNTLTIANNDLPSIEERFKRLRNDVNMLQFQKCIDERNLYQLNNKIAATTKLLISYRISCIRERREIENLNNEKTRLNSLVTGFKNNNEEYLNKIKQAAEEKIKELFTNGKLLLQFAVTSVIESLRSNPDLCNFMMYYNSNNAASLFMSGGQQRQEQ